MCVDNLTCRDFQAKLKVGLSDKLEGLNAHKQMMPEGRILQPNSSDDMQQSAVLIAFYKEKSKWVFPLIKRATYKGVHSGQIALPGGKFEDSDKSLQNTALREANEEVGICTQTVEVLGKLTSVYIPVSNNNVQPIVSCLSDKPTFVANTKEVDDILIVAVSDLLNPDNVKSEVRIFNNKELTIPYYLLNGEKVWGATAMILSELKQLLIAVKS